MRKKISILIMLAMATLTVVACGKKEDKMSYDYNQEPLANENIAWTPNGLYTMDLNGYISCVSPEGKRIALDSMPEMADELDSMDIGNKMDNLFYYKGKLSYAVVDTEHHRTTIYSMTDNLDSRQAEFAVVFPDKLNGTKLDKNPSLGYCSKIDGNIYVQEFSVTTDTSSTSKTYLTKLDEPSKPVEIDTESLGGVFRVGPQWVIFAKQDKNISGSLSGYNIKTKEQKLLVNRTNFITGDNWIADVKVKNDELYWYEYGTGFCKKEIKENTNPDKKTVICPLKEDEWLGNGMIGKDYLILCNMNSSKYPVPENKEGISFYSYDGKLVQFVSTKKQNYQYLIETEDKIFFSDSTKSMYMPAVYIEKASIKDGTAKIIKIDENKGK